MGIAVGIPLLFGVVQLAKAFAHRHEPEPPHSRLKLPVTLLMLAVCVALAALGKEPALFAALALILAVQVGFISAGRNPWWTQGALDKREYPRRLSGPPPRPGPRLVSLRTPFRDWLLGWLNPLPGP